MKTKNSVLIAIIALILTGCGSSKNALLLNIQNPSSFDRENEIVEVPWIELQKQLPASSNNTIIVSNVSGQQVPYQLVTNGSESTELLIFPATVKAGQEIAYRISIGEPDEFQSLVYGRLVPERKDDFTWENNRTAYRVYGPALEATGEISNGMDFWSKSTEDLIIDKWYENDLTKKISYHTDHGEGLDFYKVGRTLGLGMTAPLNDDSLCLGNNFISYEILDNGPLRITFRLTYNPYMAGDYTINETRIISLDAYQHFNKVTNIFETDASSLIVATGIVMPEQNPEESAESTTYGDTEGIIAYKTPENKKNGTIFTSAIHPEGFIDIKILDSHFVGLNNYQSGQLYTYYAGGGWSKAGFESFDKWVEFVKKEKQKIDQPLILKFSKTK